MYNAIIIGGGLAGLINAIVLARGGHKVVLIEKNAYPFHRVCGEYISNETIPFLRSLGFNPSLHGAVDIQRFRLTSPKGRALNLPLDLGGFGISRFRLDEALANLAEEAGAEIRTQTKVLNVGREANHFFAELPGQERVEGELVIGSFGKRSNLDRSLNRTFLNHRSPYIGVKYHIRFDHSEDLIELHNFKDGYCGISRIEDNRCCLCYLTTRENLKRSGNIPTLQNKILAKNPFLRRIFNEAEFLYDQPKVINEISFRAKPLIENGMFTCGDAAGMITPLCGNGMAMSIHGAKLLSGMLLDHLEGKTDRPTLEKEYQQSWSRLFQQRLRTGRMIQQLFGQPVITEGVVGGLRLFKPLAKAVVRQTHGQPF